jgi:predicted  nucleic acid-binding Zn-ribbon protein
VRRLALLALVVLAGCGGTSVEEYNRKGKPILADFNAAIARDQEALRDRPKDPRSYRQLADDLRRVVERLAGIGDPPTQLRTREEKLSAGLTTAAALFDEAADALDAGDERAFTEKANEAVREMRAATPRP